MLLYCTLLSSILLKVACAADVQVDLSSHFNVKAASTGLNDSLADFDGSGRAYPVEYLPKDRAFFYQGIEFALPPFNTATAYDTVRSDSQVVLVSGNSTFQSIHMLASAVWPASGAPQYQQGNITYTFEDDSESTSEFVVGPWWSTYPFDGPIHAPFHYANQTLDKETIDWNVTSISYTTLRVPNAKPLKSITLPANTTYINIFALSLLGASNSSNSVELSVQNVCSTTRWMGANATDSDRIQVVEVTLNNLAPFDAPTSKWLASPHNVTLTSDSVDTVVPGRVVRLRSNDQVVVKVGVTNKAGVDAGSLANVTVSLTPDGVKDTCEPAALQRAASWQITAGIPEWKNGDESLQTHEAPDWYDEAKFGIFIHWGVYAVPAWAPSGKQYAEWYNWQLHVPANVSSPTWVHHLETYGQDVVYDDFIANFTAANWNPDNWTDLFAGAGAKYFVLTSKHHDGFALFDTGNSSQRNSLNMGPKRNIVQDLFESAKKNHPELHRGTYFSMPEWYNPAYGPYGRGTWPGHSALNAYTGECCDPYVGYVDVNDYLADIQKPQMESLFYKHDIEILWCDIGGATVFPELGADWYNYAAGQGRQVVMNNRCGANQSDFVTPEYATFGSPLFQKWESNAGMDPFSYGYNSDTPPQNYQNASSVVTELIDIVAKGGNFLLDIGPMADGTVIPEEREPLLQVGQWLKHSGAAIYKTRPWFVQPQDTTPGLTDVRFTTTPTSFYIVAVSRPEHGRLQTAAPVPIKQGDRVRMLGGSGSDLPWSIKEGVLSVEVSDDELDMVNLPAWAFEIIYG